MANMRSPPTQNMEYKFVELMSLQYTRSPEDIVQHQITYRYNAMKVSQREVNSSGQIGILDRSQAAG